VEEEGVGKQRGLFDLRQTKRKFWGGGFVSSLFVRSWFAGKKTRMREEKASRRERSLCSTKGGEGGTGRKGKRQRKRGRARGRSLLGPT